MRSKEEKGWNVGLAWGFIKEDKKRRERRLGEKKKKVGWGVVSPLDLLFFFKYFLFVFMIKWMDSCYLCYQA